MLTCRLDANKTDLTHHITATVMGYLSGAGFKPVETEVPVAYSWIADVASFIYPTYTEAKNMKLNRRFDGSVIGHSEDWYREINYRYGGLLTALVEVKSSRADFQKDKVAKFGGLAPAHMLYLSYPTGMLKDEEIPQGWVGLKCSEDGKRLLKVVGYARVHAQHPGCIADFIAAVAIRRHHRTEYAFMRDMMRAHRASTVRYKNRRPIDALIACFKGHYATPEEAFKYYGIKNKFSREDLEYLKNVKETYERTKTQ